MWCVQWAALCKLNSARFHFFWRLQTGCLKSPKKIDNSSSQMLLLGVIPHMLYVSFICYLSCRWCDVCCVEQFLAMFCLLIYFEEGDTVPQSRQRRVSCQLTNGCTFHSINSFLPVSYISPIFAFATFFSFLCVLCQYFYNVCNVPQSRSAGGGPGWEPSRGRRCQTCWLTFCVPTKLRIKVINQGFISFRWFYNFVIGRSKRDYLDIYFLFVFNKTKACTFFI